MQSMPTKVSNLLVDSYLTVSPVQVILVIATPMMMAHSYLDVHVTGSRRLSLTIS